MTFEVNPIYYTRGHPSTWLSLRRIREKFEQKRLEAKHRAEYRRLMTLDDHILRDVGVTRDEVVFVANAPLGSSYETALRLRHSV